MFIMKFTTDSAAFDGTRRGTEMTRLLRIVAERIEVGTDGGWLADTNGNRVGHWSMDAHDEGEG